MFIHRCSVLCFHNSILKKVITISEEKDFDIIITSDIPQENTKILTTSEMGKEWLETAMRNYDAKNTAYSAYLNELSITSPVVTKEKLDMLSIDPQANLLKILEINDIARTYVNKDWIIGKVAEVLESNVNSNFKLSYSSFDGNEKKVKKLEECKKIINEFNKSINLRNLIKSSVPTTYIEGNYIFYCRGEKAGLYTYTWYPLGVVEISDYDVNGEPQVIINMRELLTRLRKTIKRTRKNKALFFEKLEEEIKANYPPEVLNAYQNKDDYAKLDRKWTGVMRVNRQNRKYGLTPIFRALYPALTLEQFDTTDNINSKAKAKKIIVQTLRKELMGQDGTNEAFEQQAWAHDNLMQAFKQKTVLVTTPAFVEKIEYVEPSTPNTDTETVMNYVNRELSTLGISFLMSSGSTGASVASISLDQLMKTINSISEQLEYIMERFYKNILEANGHSSEFIPTIRVLDSELLEMEVKQELAKLLYCNFNVSLETALSILGFDVNDEKAKRQKENKEGMDEIFKAHESQFTKSSVTDNKAGRPDGNKIDTKDKQNYDEQYNTNARV